MAAGLYNCTIRQGSTFRESFQLLDREATDEATKAIDLNGCQARMQIRRTVGATAPLFSFTGEHESMTLDVQSSTIEVELPVVTTAGLPFRTAVYDLEV